MVGIIDILCCYPIYESIKRYCDHCDLVCLHRANIIKLSEKDIRVLKANISPEVILFKTPQDRYSIPYWKPIADGIAEGKIKLWGKDLVYFLNVHDLPSTIQLNITITRDSSVTRKNIVVRLCTSPYSYSRASVHIEKWKQEGPYTLSRKLTESCTVILYIWQEPQNINYIYYGHIVSTIVDLPDDNNYTLYSDSKMGMVLQNVTHTQHEITAPGIKAVVLTVGTTDGHLCIFSNYLNAPEQLNSDFFTKYLNPQMPKHLYNKYIPHIRENRLLL